MNTNHLTDVEIQQYTFDRETCNDSTISHMERCSVCKAKAGVYQAISSEVKNMPSPVFDFDLPGLVLSRVRQPRSKFSFTLSVMYIVAFIAFAILCLFLQPYITSVFVEILPSIFYIITVSAVIITVFQVIDMHKNHQNKMNRLNLY